MLLRLYPIFTISLSHVYSGLYLYPVLFTITKSAGIHLPGYEKIKVEGNFFESAYQRRLRFFQG